MLKKWMAVTALMSLGGAVEAATYVVLPAPGSMEPATVIVDRNSSPGGPVFVCASVSEVLTGTCRPYRKAAR